MWYIQLLNLLGVNRKKQPVEVHNEFHVHSKQHAALKAHKQGFRIKLSVTARKVGAGTDICWTDYCWCKDGADIAYVLNIFGLMYMQSGTIRIRMDDELVPPEKKVEIDSEYELSIADWRG